MTIDYTCPGPVGTVTVAVRMLTDLNSAYQTLPTGPDGERTVYGPGHDSHDWALRDAPATGGTDLGRRAVIQIAVVVGGVLLVAVAALGAVPPVEPTAVGRRIKPWPSSTPRPSRTSCRASSTRRACRR